MTEFRAYRCWARTTVQETIWSDVGAFGLGEDALFLATHISLPIERVKPFRDVTNEHAVLLCLQEAVDLSGNLNLVIAVTGPSGSGKSHLVRWIRAQLDPSDPRLEVVYIPRRVTTLREITQLLLHSLGGTIAEELQEELDRSVGNTGPRQLALALYNRLTEVLTYRPIKEGAAYGETLLPIVEQDAIEAVHGGLAYLLGQDKVRDHFLKQGGTLDRLAHSILGKRGRAEDADLEKPSYGSEDLQLSKLTGIRTGLPNHAVTALTMLTKEAGRDAAAALLNRHRDGAIQEVLGIRQGRGLHEVFSDARRRLHGKQLVLMFEDLALIDFIEGAVLDEFANHGDEQHAPLRVVFAVTDDKYATLAETIEGRVTDHFTVGEAPLHETTTQADLHRRNEFFGRYFNAGRVGHDALIDAHSAGAPVPNACADCKHRTICHETFGAVETDIGPLGLYPLNAKAVGHGIASQFNERHQQQRVLTPRVVIDELIKFVLLQAYDDLGSDSMPSDRLASVMDDGRAMVTPVDLVPEFAEGSAEQGRYFRVRAWWFDCAQEPAAVVDAFALPPVPDVTLEPATATPPLTRPPAVDTPGALPETVQTILRWAQGTDLDPRTSAELRVLLRTLTEQRVSLDRFLVHSTSSLAKALLRAAIGDASFRIGDTGRRSGKQLEFSVDRSNASTRLLMAAIWLRDHEHWDFDHPQRRWTMPLQNVSTLPVELETFLGGCATQVEGAIVACLFVSGTDPVATAVAAKRLAELAAMPSGESPVAWAPVAIAAQGVLQSDAADDVVVALAGARQSATASPAAIDTLRTAQPKWDHLPPEAEELPEAFVSLTHPWAMLRRAVLAAIEPTGEELLRLLSEVQEWLGDDTLAAVASAVGDAIMLANNENALEPDAPLYVLNNAVERLTTNHFDPVVWREPARRVQASGPDPRVLLEMLAATPEMIEAHEDLRLAHRTLTRTREVIDKRIGRAGGSGSPDAMRVSALEAHAALLAQVRS